MDKWNGCRLLIMHGFLSLRTQRSNGNQSEWRGSRHLAPPSSLCLCTLCWLLLALTDWSHVSFCFRIFGNVYILSSCFKDAACISFIRYPGILTLFCFSHLRYANSLNSWLTSITLAWTFRPCDADRIVPDRSSSDLCCSVWINVWDAFVWIMNNAVKKKKQTMNVTWENEVIFSYINNTQHKRKDDEDDCFYYYW